MRFLFPLLGLLSAACTTTPAQYTVGDPLAATGPKPQTLYEVVKSSNGAKEKRPLLSAVIPEGYAPSDAIVSEPVVAIIGKEVYGGEAAVVVERYAARDGNAVDKETFIKNLLPGEIEIAPVKHALGGKEFKVYHGLEFSFYDRRIGPGDPYSDSLAGSIQPPKLSFLEGRRFPIGGEAYKLYRCLRLGAWDVLGDYRRALATGKVEDFLTRIRGSTDGKLIAPCFGRTVIHSVSERQPVPDIPKPSMARLRMMARDEWEHGAAHRVERECIYLQDVPGGFMVLRFRAPHDTFDLEHRAFEAFLASFQPL